MSLSPRVSDACGGGSGGCDIGLLTRVKPPQQQDTLWHRERRIAPNTAATKVEAPPMSARTSAVDDTIIFLLLFLHAS